MRGVTVENTNVSVTLRPTVLLGLGGTGHDLLLQVKRRLMDRFSQVPPCISLLSIDGADPDKPVIQTSDGRNVELDPMSERFLIQVASSENLIGDTNEHIAQWWPANTPVSAITAGATQIRPRGRLGFFAKYTEIIRALENVISNVTNARNLDILDRMDIRLSDRLGIDVYILSSLAGGTGSGMLLDIAFNMRKLCDATTNITGTLVLPRVFSRDPGIRQKPNAYAALKEVEFFMKIRQGQSFTIDYGGDSSVQVTKPPFDLAFLIDSINEQGSSISRDDLFSVIGEGIYLLIASQVGSKSSNSLDNIKGKLSGVGTIRARSAAYCSFGVASLATDRKLRQVEEDARTGALGLVEQLLGSYRGDEAEREPIDFVPQEVIENLISSSQRRGGFPIDVSLNVLGLPKERDRILSDLKTRYDRRKKEVESSVAESVRDAAATALAEIKRRGREWWLERTSSLGGLEEIARRAPASILDLDSRITALKKEAVEKEEMLLRFRGEGEAVRAQIEQSIEIRRYILGGRLRIGKFSRRISDLFSAEFSSYCELEARRAAIRLLESSKESLREYLGATHEVVEKLELAKSSLGSHGAGMNHVETRNPFEHILQIAEYPSTDASPSRFIEWFNQKYGNLEALKSYSSSEVTQLIYDFVGNGKSVSQQNGTIQSALSHKAREEKKVILKRLSDLASPLWSPDESKIPLPHDTVLEMSCYGVSDAEKHSLEDLNESALGTRSAPTFVSLFQDRITLFRIKAGVPLFALSGLEELENAYYRQPDRATCHVDARWQSFPDLIPARNKASFHDSRSIDLLWFVLALTPPFSFIVEQSGSYLSNADDPERPPLILLGDDLRTAFGTFGENRLLVQRVEQMIRGALKKRSEREVIEALENQLKVLREGRKERRKDFEVTGFFETAIVMLEEFMEKPASFPQIE
jgi:hypothetical protein